MSAEIADELRAKLRDEWLRKATSSFTCQECGIQANFIDEILDALDAMEAHKRAQAEDIMTLGKEVGQMWLKAVSFVEQAALMVETAPGSVTDRQELAARIRAICPLDDPAVAFASRLPNKEDRNG